MNFLAFAISAALTTSSWVNSLEYLEFRTAFRGLLDVVVDGGIEKSWFLADHTEGVSQVLDIEFLDVQTIDKYLPSLGVVEPQQQTENGRLPGP